MSGKRRRSGGAGNSAAPAYLALGAALKPLLERLSTALETEGLYLEDELGVDPTTIENWKRGSNRPEFPKMYALLRLVVKYQILDRDEIAELHRRWLSAYGWTDPQMLDIITRKAAYDELSQTCDELRAEHALLQKQLQWADLMRELSDLFWPLKHRYQHLNQNAPTPDLQALGAFYRKVEEDVIEGEVLRRVCVFYCLLAGDASLQLVRRAAILTPTRQDERFLAIKWAHNLPNQSFKYDHWYCGDDDPPEGKHRGFAGDVYRTGVGEVIPDIYQDEAQRFRDLWRRPRDRKEIPYKSLVKAPIRHGVKKFGVLGFDSLDYTFTKQDLVLIDELAVLLGELFAAIRMPCKSKFRFD